MLKRIGNDIGIEIEVFGLNIWSFKDEVTQNDTSPRQALKKVEARFRIRQKASLGKDIDLERNADRKRIEG